MSTLPFVRELIFLGATYSFQITGPRSSEGVAFERSEIYRFRDEFECIMRSKILAQDKVPVD